MFGELFGRGCFGEKFRGCSTNSSCDVLWIIILLLIVFKGGFFGIDICTIVILFIIFGKDFFFCDKHHERKC